MASRFSLSLHAPPSLSSPYTRLVTPAWKSRQCLQHPRALSSTPIYLEDKATSKIPPPPADFDDDPIPLTTSPKKAPKTVGFNQHLPLAHELQGYLRSLMMQFRAPVRYAFAYGSGVFSQGAAAARASGKKPMIDLMFGVTYTQHWHSLNLGQHRDHYSFMGTLGSGAISYVQDKMGAGVYFNPYVDINGTLVKYGVTNIDTLRRDLKTWDTLYLAGRLQKPVQILRDDPTITLSYQANLIAATRTALLMLPERFTEYQLYSTITGISYLGDPRMSVGAENPNKIDNIVDNQLAHFRLLYGKVIEQLPNLSYEKGGGQEWSEPAQQTWLVQDMSPSKRANMVRRLPTSFREKLYFQYQRKFAIPALEFEKMVNLSEDDERAAPKQGGEFEKRIVEGGTDEMADKVKKVIKSTISWPSTAQSLKGVLTAGPVRSAKYLTEKMGKWRRGGKAKVEEQTKEN
ncbi:uncharacterized protein LAJ45_07098 [Morchella importuna]|uniref:Phosphatidate cytidylyltransferase, mitochondrial n=1 Tax=Morchella conica CCBAS932 TaxID=1392247 RepID=A0A3N4KND2_9PEZI|nr:uncharacterized protein LAJ45_07098 [Morchella importuna]KAH8148755.1 hypothetical protein LAJ45_07098 [Morchella importuna]RPB10948.1 Mmp37-domain-containing protein [Morchella conica CCBAS932]